MRSKSCFYGRSIRVGNTMENVKQINLLNYAERVQREREMDRALKTICQSLNLIDI